MGERKRRRGSKKGTPFEREICKKISEWWSQGASDNIFWRTSQSGGRATTRAKLGKSSNLHCSDLCAIDPSGEPLLKLTIIELKKGYSKNTIHDLMDCPNKSIRKVYEEWIGKAESDRQRAGAYYWTLIHMRDSRKPIIFMPHKLFTCLLREGALPGNRTYFYLELPDGTSINGTTLEEFLEGTSKEHIISVLGKLPSNGAF